jgi:hypothetical protein
MYLCEDCRKQLYAYKYNSMLQHYRICDRCNKPRTCCDVQILSKRDVKNMTTTEDVIKEE